MPPIRSGRPLPSAFDAAEADADAGTPDQVFESGGGDEDGSMPAAPEEDADKDGAAEEQGQVGRPDRA